MNSVNLIGNLTRDPDVRYTQSGSAVCEIGVALNEKYKDKSGNWQDKTCFIDVTCWGRTAEVAGDYLKKGAKVGIEGRLEMDEWQDKETGNKRTKLKVVCTKLHMLSKSERGQSRSDSGPEEETPF